MCINIIKMLYLMCPCGEVLGNKQLVYEEYMKKACDEMGIDFEMISKGLVDGDEKYKKKRSEIVEKLCRRLCCKHRLITYVNLVDLIR